MEIKGAAIPRGLSSASGPSKCAGLDGYCRAAPVPRSGEASSKLRCVVKQLEADAGSASASNGLSSCLLRSGAGLFDVSARAQLFLHIDERFLTKARDLQ